MDMINVKINIKNIFKIIVSRKLDSIINKDFEETIIKTNKER